MNLRTLLRSLVWAWGLCAGSLMAQTQRIEGHVLLSDSLHAASFASIYVPATGQGTVCDKEGHFLLEGRYYYGLGNIYGDTKRDYFAKSNLGAIIIKMSYLFDIAKTSKNK